VSAWPLVSAIVLNRDGAAHLRRLLAGLVERTDYPNLELVVVDNASSDDSLDFLRRVEAPFPIAVLANAHNESFSVGCNQGADVAAGELLLFLNNDSEPFAPTWLRELVHCLRRADAGAVAPTLVEPAPEAGPSRYRVEQRGHRIAEHEGLLVPVYRDRGLELPADGELEDIEVAAVAAACLLTTREAFDDAGGFTHGYWYGGEDSDLALKLRERGKSVVCSGRSLLVHSPSATLADVPSRLRAEWMRGNRRLFMERWGPRIRRELELDRLRGGGLWAEPAPISSAWGSTQEEVEALGFCLQSAAPEARAGEEPRLEEVAAALRDRGHRATVLRAEAIEGLASCEYDVVVHDGAAGRYVPKPAQLNILWPPADVAAPPTECPRYDLVLESGREASPRSAEDWAEHLVEASENLARAAERRGWSRRIDRR
jgi:GT2 family glycosyltransferase